MTIQTGQGIQWLIDKLNEDQLSDGSWNYPFDTGVLTDAYMIILIRTLEREDKEELIEGLAARIISKKEDNGWWKLYHDEPKGNLALTVESYYALLYSGYYAKNDSRLLEARSFITSNGGIEKVNIFSKIMLAITGQYKWPSLFPVPVEVMLLPLSFPLNFYQISVYGRTNLAPILIVAENKFSKKTSLSPDLSDLFIDRTEDEKWEYPAEWRSLFSTIESGVKSLIGLPSHLHSLAIERAESYILDRLEPDGTFYSYFSSTFLMVFALLSLKYPKNHTLISKAVDGLISMKTEIKGLPHMQYTTANVWNTSLISTALQSAGVPANASVISNANRYLLERQHYKFGDWAIHNPQGRPGGWGFSNVNTMNPDMDDTTAVLRSIVEMVPGIPAYREAWDRGLYWLFTMQNDDGGWASFEKNIKNKWIEFLPVEKAEYMFSDPSSADLTGRTIEFFGNYTNLARTHPAIKQAVNWLMDYQETNSSWYSRWGICYINGTWAAVTGLRAVGLPTANRAIPSAVTWLKSIQNSDGGWGESCLSDSKKEYVPLRSSTLTDTAWALDALIMAEDHPSKEIHRGVEYLLNSIKKEDWTTEYPKGQAMAGTFYIHYHSYRFIFPLLALAHYRDKFE
ncbi:prenyltransferase/squalene oxidase repeat-containing protein [Halobacillus sp. A5]|uniref:terpene cyclase/mutase family protein n=1 Tax=Halobacillus sp. A5 TaxID=2880263 RepID=UPI0020A6D28D|nr:prenyltransferase/squalene oxidase repeat-containing protein [Halobacillus sp. A5]MCP3028618.1 squalene--hopene cyclase [Halobacillus sp. A5]